MRETDERLYSEVRKSFSFKLSFLSLKKFFQFLCYTREKFMTVSNLHKKASLLSNFFKENLLFFLYFFSIPIHSVSGLYVNKTTRQKDSFKSSCF